jgi:hypothetical protein
MRLPLIFIILALSMSACGQPQRNASCALTATREMAWEANGARTTLAASTEGEACETAHARLELRGPDNTPRHTIDAPLHALMIGGPAPEGAAPIARDDAQRFLDSWIDAEPMQASALPAWPPDSPAPGAGGALPYRTPLSQAEYEAMRAHNGAVLCLATQVDGVECFAIEPDTGNVDLVLGYAP